LKHENEEEILNLSKKIEIATGETVDKISHLRQTKFEYVNLRDLGAMNSPSISNQYMGRFLKKCGLTISSSGRTIPDRRYINNGLSISR